MVTCKICNKKYKAITNTHLQSAHEISIEEYKDRFGNAGVGFAFQPQTLKASDPRYKKWKKGLEGKKPWNKGHTKETHPAVAKTSRTMKEKKIDNFARWRMKAKREGLIQNKYPEFKKNSDLAFLIGIVMGDGHIQQFPRTQRLNITLGTDKPDLWKYTSNVVERVFHKHPHVGFRKRSKAVDISIYQKKISERLMIPVGARKGVKIGVPKWIWQEDTYLVSWLRGLYEAEGTFAVHRPTYTYKMIFTNVNASLLNKVYDALVKLGFTPHRSPKKIQVSKKEEVYALKKLMQFRKY